MLKASLIAGLFASLTMGATIAANASNQVETKERDTNIIVEVNRDMDRLTEDGILNSQKLLLSNIRSSATSNFRVLQNYTKVANAFALSVNAKDVEAIRNVPGVKSVTLDEMHWKTEYIEPVENEGAIYLEEESGGSGYDESINASAITMNKSDDTYDGEGTVVAILDNEFYFRAKTDDDPKGWGHKTFTNLPTTVKMKYNGARPDGYDKTIAWKYVKDNGISVSLGYEGSLYYNRKVPFYFDYGGESEVYSAKYSQDLDVSSLLTYHGSHVASISAGNDDDYKGIAPKAQLVCMKVFTTYHAKGVEAQMGFSTSTGAYDIPIMNALEDCITLGVDGINMSLGSNLDDFDKNSITLKTLRRLARSGVLTSISAGNSGKSSYESIESYANWTLDMVETGILSSYANQGEVMTVASGNPDRIFYKTAFKMGSVNVAFEDQIVNREGYDDDYKNEIKMTDLLGEDKTKPIDWIYVDKFGDLSDYDPKKIYEGKIIVVNRGNTTFADKYNNAVSNGAIGVIIINNDPTSSDFNFRCSFGEGFRPTVPCALVLFEDKEKFASQGEGTFQIISNEVLDNPNKRTISNYSTDGATYDLDLKPDITTPGGNIKGAVPPQKKEDKEQTPLSTYEYLSGTSMSAPNYAGAQSVVLSKVTGNGQVLNSKNKKAINEFRKTVDMRLMSTAVPALDSKNNPEDDTLSVTSPRRQGAGLVHLGNAYHTDVYLEGMDLEGNPIGKSKIALRNNPDINRGDIKLSFIAHNESDENKNYNVKVSIYRPAVAASNAIISKEYQNKGEVADIVNFPGVPYWVYLQGAAQPFELRTGSGDYAYMDAISVTKDIEYFATEAAIRAYYDKDGEHYLDDSLKAVIKQGKYYNAATTGVDWKDLPTKNYQSVKDVLVREVNLGNLTVAPGNNTYTLDTISLTDTEKNKIAEYFEYGCFIEGYITLESTEGEGGINLNMPYLGFYAGEGKSYESAPVVEPFEFEKDPATIYPSDLVNDIAKTLLGKDKADMSSLLVAGYLKPGESINQDKILQNNENIKNLVGFYPLGSSAKDGSYPSNPSDNLYAGSAYKSNTLVVQQFVLRSVANNYFTLTNKETNQLVYKSVLEDMLFGDYMGTYPLYKSHIDDSYLGAGYVAHRAYGVIPLYNEDNGVAFPNGDYELKFNYLLAGTNTWVSKAYTIHIDSELPEVSSIKEVEGDKVRINIKETNLVSASVGKYITDFHKDAEGGYYIELTKEQLNEYINENRNEGFDSGRLYIQLEDEARGINGIVARFQMNENDEANLNNYAMIQHRDLTYTNDFQYTSDGSYKVYSYNPRTFVNTEIVLDGAVLFSIGDVRYEEQVIVSGGCGGDITATSVILSTIALAGVVLLLVSKAKKNEKELGGNSHE